jgi:uncharacterized membrane protein
VKNRWLLVSLTATVLMWAATFAVYGEWFGPLAEKIPVHWNAAGQADHLVSRDAILPYLLIGPTVMIGWVALTFALPWLSPRGYDIEKFRPTYDFVMALVVLMMGYIQVIQLLVALGVPMPFLQVFLGGVFLFLAAMGNVLGKVRRNFYLGVRTPWTLASETVWNRTHRLAAWTLTSGGIVGFLLILLGVPVLVAFGIFLAALLIPAVYSLVLYKQLERSGRLGE